MSEFLLALGLVVIVIAGMSIGVMFGRKPISGSCGGLNNRNGGGTCELCGGNPNKCEENDSEGGKADLAYDAGSKS